MGPSVYTLIFFFSDMILLLHGQVVMRSGDAELEMRGRCSAGQKVKKA